MSVLFSKRNKSFDWITFTIYIALITIGWLMIYSASAGPGADLFGGFDTQHGKQLIWIVVGVTGLLATLLVPYVFWRNFSFIIYFLAIVLLMAVLIFGKEIKGAQSWFSIGGFTFQPAEFAKLATALALGAYTASTSFKINNRRALLTGMGLFLVPAGLVLLQPDAGSTLVFFSFFILLYRLGLWHGYYVLFLSSLTLFITSTIFGPLYVIVFLLALGCSFLLYQLDLNSTVFFFTCLAGLVTTILIAELYNKLIWAAYFNAIAFVVLALSLFFKRKSNVLTLAIPSMLLAGIFTFSSSFLVNNLLEPHQRERIQVWLQPDNCDPRGSLYNVIQSKVAISSGGLTGKGFAEGSMTKLNYVPEQSTDFIFCTVGEEQGFLGVISILILYAVFISRIFLLSEESRKPFTKYYGYGLGGILFFHYFINIGMTMGLVPIIGIPLPFLSYGGSSLIFFSLMVGIFLRLQLDDR